MPVLVHTGARVAPGDALFSSAAHVPTGSDASAATADDTVSDSDVIPGEGCVVHYVEIPSESTGDSSRVRRHIVATRQGVAQWDGRLVSVFAAGATGTTAQLQGASTAVRSAVTGPRPGDTVHVRITRLSRLFAFGEITAVNWQWCSHRSAAGASVSGVFKGVLRLEDIRPFRPTRDQLQPPPPTMAFALGDVVLAEVISQSDAHQYQLSTVGEGFGVVESYVSTAEEHYSGRERVKLQHLPGRRDAMLVPATGAVVPRWCPLLP